MSRYLVMVSPVLIAVGTALLTRRRRFALTAGAVAWIPPVMYFLVEAVVIAGTTKPYSALWQPMGDLGVTTCDANVVKLLTSRDICSPLHDLMNWTFVVTGIAVCLGAIWLRAWWPGRGRRLTIATVLLVVFGLSNALAGVIPANVAFGWHVGVSLPGMVVQLPALFLIAVAIRPRTPGLARWTIGCAVAGGLSLLGLIAQPWLELPGGLLERALYGFEYLWAAVAGIWLWCYWKPRTSRRCHGVSTA